MIADPISPDLRSSSYSPSPPRLTRRLCNTWPQTPVTYHVYPTSVSQVSLYRFKFLSTHWMFIYNISLRNSCPHVCMCRLNIFNCGFYRLDFFSLCLPPLLHPILFSFAELKHAHAVATSSSDMSYFATWRPFIFNQRNNVTVGDMLFPSLQIFNSWHSVPLQEKHNMT